MTVHPILNPTYVDSSNVAKGNIRGYEKLCFFAANVSDVESRDLTGTLVCLVPFSNSGRSFFIDPSDSTTVSDHTTVLVDTAGNRFKIRPIATADLTAALLNSVYGTGGASGDILPTPGFDPAFMGHDVDGHWSPRAIGAVVTWLDTFLGGPAWRTTASASQAAATVKSFPSNTWKNGCDKGHTSTAMLFADGQVGVTGLAAASPDSNGVFTTTRYFKIPFVDGVQRTITKYWAGGFGSYYALDSNGIVWGFGQNGNGQLGLGDLNGRTKWAEITFFRTNSLTVSDIVTNSLGAYFITTSGLLYYAGYNGFGQAGNGNTTQQTSPVRCGTLTSVTAVYAGGSLDTGNGNDNVGCVSGGTFYTWGINSNGQCGLGNLTSPQSSPVSTGITGVTKACMGIYSLLMKSDGTCWSAGYGGDGGCCQGNFTGNNTWTQIASLGTTVLDIAGAVGRFCPGAAIVTVGGSGRYLRTWGYNGNGNLGIGNTTNQNTVQSPTGTWQGSVDEIGACDQSIASGVGQLFVRVGNRLLSCGYNGAANLVNGTQSGNTSTFGDVLGILGNIQSMYVWCRDSVTILSVMTDQGVFNGGCNTDSALATHEFNLHNQSVLNPILTSSLAKGNDGTNFVFDAIGTLSNKTTYDSQPAGFRYVAYDDSPTAKMYQRVTTVTGTWTSGVPVFGSFAFGAAITPTNIATQQDNYAPTGFATCGVIRQGATTDCTITGLAGGATNRVVLFTNLGPNTITLSDANVSSTAANRFALGGDQTLVANSSCALWYDNTQSRWVNFGDKSAEVAAAAAAIWWDTRAKMWSPADGVIELTNNAGTDFARLQLGGTTASFPAIKRSAAAVAFRLADDSADAAITAAAITSSAKITSSSPAANGIGYATGAGSTATQATSKATGVSFNANCGAITLNAAALAASTTVSFVFTNTSIAVTDVLILNHISGGTPGSYTLNARCAAGSATIDVRNVSLGSLSEGIVIQFAVVKAVNA